MGRVIEVSLLPFPLLESPIYTLIAMIDSPSVPLQKHAVPPILSDPPGDKRVAPP